MRLQLFIISLFLSINLFCQTSTDSIINVLNKLPNDEQKLTELYNSLENYNFSKDTVFEKLFIEYITKAKRSKNYNYELRFTTELANYYIFNSLNHQKADSILIGFSNKIDSCNHIKDIGRFYIAYSEASIYMQNHKKALDILKNAITFFEKEKDSTLYEFAYAYLKAGEATIALDKVSESAGYFKKAEELFTYQKDTLLLLWTKNGLSTLLSKNGLFDEAEQERKIIYEIGPKIGQFQVVAMAHLRAALDAGFLEKPKEELYHIREALHNNNENSDIQEIVSILTLSIATSVFAENKKIDSSNYYLNKLNLKMKGLNNNAFINSYYKSAIAYNAFARKDYDLAKKNALITLNIINKNSTLTARNLEIELLLAEIYKKKSNLKKSLHHLNNYIQIKDSITQSNTIKKFAYVQTQFETEKKDLQIVQQEKNIALLNAENQVKNQWLLFGFLALFSLFSTIYLWRLKQFSKKKQKLQESFTQDIIKTQDNERSRIAKELHDSIGQKLLVLKNTIQLKDVIITEEVNLLDETIKEVREMSHNLHPFQFEKLGLLNSLEDLIAAFQKSSSVFYSAEIQDFSQFIPKEKELFIYRILQECISNVEKHSEATACNLSVKEEKDHLIFQLKDNGKGFNVQQKFKKNNSLGLISLQERAEYIGVQLTFDSSEGKGTIITLKIAKKWHQQL